MSWWEAFWSWPSALVFGLEDEPAAPAEKPLPLQLVVDKPIADVRDRQVGQKLATPTISNCSGQYLLRNEIGTPITPS